MKDILNTLIVSHQNDFFPFSSGSPFFWSLWEVKTATRKCFNISLPPREIYEGYQIFISRQRPSVKALRNFCCRKRPGKAARQGVGKGKGRLERRGSPYINIWPLNTFCMFYIIEEHGNTMFTFCKHELSCSTNHTQMDCVVLIRCDKEWERKRACCPGNGS